MTSKTIDVNGCVRLSNYGDYMLVCDSTNDTISSYTKNNQLAKTYNTDHILSHFVIIDGELYANESVFDLDGNMLRSFTYSDRDTVRCGNHSLVSIIYQYEKGYCYCEKDECCNCNMGMYANISDMSGNITSRCKIQDPNIFGLFYYQGICYIINVCDVLSLWSIDEHGQMKKIFNSDAVPNTISDFFIYENHVFVWDKFQIYVYSMDGNLVYEFTTPPAHKNEYSRYMRAFNGQLWMCTNQRYEENEGKTNKIYLLDVMFK